MTELELFRRDWNAPAKTHSQEWYDDVARLLKSRDDAIKLHKDMGDEGNIFAVLEVGSGKGNIERPNPPKRMRDLTGFSYFTVGPLYTFCNVDRDILEAFTQITADDKDNGRFVPERVAIRLSKPWMDVCHNGWDYMLEALTTSYLDYLTKMLETQRFRVRHPKTGEMTYWAVSWTDFVVPDLLALENNAVVGADGTNLVRIFLPTGTPGRLYASPTSNYPVRLVATQSEAWVRSEAAKMLPNLGHMS